MFATGCKHYMRVNAPWNLLPSRDQAGLLLEAAVDETVRARDPKRLALVQAMLAQGSVEDATTAAEILFEGTPPAVLWGNSLQV